MKRRVAGQEYLKRKIKSRKRGLDVELEKRVLGKKRVEGTFLKKRSKVWKKEKETKRLEEDKIE